MEITIKDIKVKEGITKSGPNAGKPWKLIILIGQDGTEFTTFDASAQEVGIGGIIELEPIIKAGKINFTEFKIIQKGQPPVVASSNGKPDMSKDDWAEKDRITRRSIERQKSVDVASSISDDINKLLVNAEQIYKWISNDTSPDKPATQPQQGTMREPTQSKSTGVKAEGSTFADIGKFYQACMDNFKLNKSLVDAEIKGTAMLTEENWLAAYKALAMVHGGQDEANTTKEVEATETDGRTQTQKELDPHKLFE